MHLRILPATFTIALEEEEIESETVWTARLGDMISSGYSHEG